MEERLRDYRNSNFDALTLLTEVSNTVEELMQETKPGPYRVEWVDYDRTQHGPMTTTFGKVLYPVFKTPEEEFWWLLKN